MKKVGIVTWYWGNYGSILQAYALQQAIAELGLSCEVINHRVNGNIKEQMFYRVRHSGILNTIYYYTKKLGATIENHSLKELSYRNKAFNNFIKNNIQLSSEFYTNNNYYRCQQYDAYICGSDQIWNPNFTFLSSFYWLGFVNEKTKIAYAPSMGSELLTASDKEKISAYLKSFTGISVREIKSAEILSKLSLHHKVYTVVDPTMLITAEKWKEHLPKKSISEKYLFAYIIRGNKEQRNYIEKIARKYNLQLVVYPYLESNIIESDEKTWGDIRCFEDEPFDFLEKIYNAEMIITDSFHCSVFSILFHKEFFVLKKINDKTSQFGRLQQLLKMSSQEKRIIDMGDNVVPLGNNFYKSDIEIEKKRIESINYLKKSLHLC